MTDSVLAVPETVLEEEVWDEHLQQLHFEFSNPNFGRNSNLEETSRGAVNQNRAAEEYHRPANPISKSRTRSLGEDNIGKSLSVGRWAWVLDDSPTKISEELGHKSKRTNLPKNSSLGLGRVVGVEKLKSQSIGGEQASGRKGSKSREGNSGFRAEKTDIGL